MKSKQMTYKDHLEKHPEQVEDKKEALRLAQSGNQMWTKKFGYSINRLQCNM